MKRRDFITLLGGAAVAGPLPARAQQAAMPVIGLLDLRSPDAMADRLRAFRQGLKETGHVEGENVAIEYRWAEGQYDRLPALAAELVRRQVAVIVASPGAPSALAAKSATATIPIVFTVGDDPVKLGLVSSLARPGGNLTGVNYFGAEVVSKRLELLREVIPGVGRLAVLVNPSNAAISETTVREVEAAARGMGVQVLVFNAGTSREIDDAFANLVRENGRAFAIKQSIANSRGPVVSRSRAANAASELRELRPAGRTVRTTRPTNDLVSLSAFSASLVGRKGMLKATAVRGVESSRCGDRNRARRADEAPRQASGHNHIARE
jgi:putative tryptophan/tyrosine transport system substrate-binding protein